MLGLYKSELDTPYVVLFETALLHLYRLQWQLASRRWSQHGGKGVCENWASDSGGAQLASQLWLPTDTG